MIVCGVDGLVEDPRLSVMLSLEEARKELHLEALCNAVRRQAFVSRLLPLHFAHALALALDIAHAAISLVPMLQLFIFICEQRFCLRGRGE